MWIDAFHSICVATNIPTVTIRPMNWIASTRQLWMLTLVSSIFELISRGFSALFNHFSTNHLTIPNRWFYSHFRDFLLKLSILLTMWVGKSKMTKSYRCDSHIEINYNFTHILQQSFIVLVQLYVLHSTYRCDTIYLLQRTDTEI